MNALALRSVSLALLACLPAPASAFAMWRLVSKSIPEERTTLAAFVDERTGLRLDGGVVLYTQDGGRTWLESAAADSARHALELLPEGFAWHAGALTVARSFDRGRTWYRAGNFGGADPEPVISLSFADENRGLIATRTRLGWTDDGGLRWTSLPLPGWAEEAAAVSLSIAPPPAGDASRAMVASLGPKRVVGRVLDTGGRLWISHDRGVTWSYAESPIAGRRFRVAGGVATTALRFTRAGTGALAAFVQVDGSARLRIFRFTPGEAGWTEDLVPTLDEPGALYLSPDGRVLTWKALERNELRVYVRDA